MGIIKTAKLIYEYITYDENEKEEDSRAIDGVDINVEPGQFVAILGHNGSGKSTFAKHINALLVPTEGTIWIGWIWIPADESDISGIVRQKAGMVFQNPDNQIIGTVLWRKT